MEDNNKDQHEQDPKQDKAVDRAGTGQTDEEKGIAPKEVREQKKKELEEEGKAIRRPTFNRDDDELPLQMKDDKE